MKKPPELLRELETKLNYNSQYGSISVEESKKDEGRATRWNNTYCITFTTPTGNSVNLRNRKAVAINLQNLLENFGEFIPLNQFRNDGEEYSSLKTIGEKIRIINALIIDTEYIVERNPEPHNYTCRILNKNSQEL